MPNSSLIIQYETYLTIKLTVTAGLISLKIRLANIQLCIIHSIWFWFLISGSWGGPAGFPVSAYTGFGMYDGTALAADTFPGVTMSYLPNCAAFFRAVL